MHSNILVFTAFLVFLFILSIVPDQGDHFQAYAICSDEPSGELTQESLCPRDFGRYPAYLNYNISTSNGHTVAKLSLHDNSTGDTLKYTAFFISISSTENMSREIMRDLFQAQDGILTLDFIHSNNTGSGEGEQITVYGMQDPFLNAWTAEPLHPITIANFPFVANETYMMHIEVIRVDAPRNIFTPETAPKVDFIFSTNENPDSEGKVLVVPEFSPLVSLAIMAALMGIVVMMGRMTRVRGWKG